MPEMRVVAVSVGQPAIIVRGGRQYSSSINRQAITETVELSETGIVGDRVADSENHGGRDRALCCYPHEHYALWEQRLATDLPIPSFGENLTTTGLLEDQVCLGDKLRIASAVVEVSQPRRPCWRLADKHREPELPQWITSTGYTGFHVRVLDNGRVSSADALALLDRPYPDLTVLLATRTLFADDPDRDLLIRFAELPVLSGAWRRQMARRLATVGERHI